METNDNIQIGTNPKTGASELQVILPIGEKENLITDHKAAIDLLTEYSDEISDDQRSLLERLIQCTTPTYPMIKRETVLAHTNTLDNTNSIHQWPKIQIRINDQEEYNWLLAATIEMLDEIIPETQKPKARLVEQWKSTLLLRVLRELNPSEMQKAS